MWATVACGKKAMKIGGQNGAKMAQIGSKVGEFSAKIVEITVDSMVKILEVMVGMRGYSQMVPNNFPQITTFSLVSTLAHPSLSDPYSGVLPPPPTAGFSLYALWESLYIHATRALPYSATAGFSPLYYILITLPLCSVWSIPFMINSYARSKTSLYARGLA